MSAEPGINNNSAEKYDRPLPTSSSASSSADPQPQVQGQSVQGMVSMPGEPGAEGAKPVSTSGHVASACKHGATVLCHGCNGTEKQRSLSAVTPLARLESAVEKARDCLADSPDAKVIFEVLNDAARVLAASTTPQQAMVQHTALYECLLLTSARLNTRHQIPSFCGLCWRTQMPKQNSVGSHIPVPIAGSHIESDCLLVALGSFIKEGKVVTSSKVKDPLCCRTDGKADCSKLATCEGVTGECEADLKPLLESHVAGPEGSLTHKYRRSLWVAVSAIGWRRLVHDCEKYFEVVQDNPTYRPVLDGLLKLEKALRMFLCSLVDHVSAVRAQTSTPPALMDPSFLLFLTVAPALPHPPASMHEFVRHANVSSFVAPLSAHHPCPYLICFSMLNMHFVLCLKDGAEELTKAPANQPGSTWIAVQWPDASNAELSLEIPDSAHRVLHPTIEAMLNLQADALVAQQQSIHQNSSLAGSFAARTAGAAGASAAAAAIQPQAGQCLFALPDFIQYNHTYPSFGSFAYGQRLTPSILLQHRSPNGGAFMEVTRLTSAHPKAPSYWCICVAEKVNNDAVLVGACSFDVNNQQLVSNSVKMLAKTGVMEGREQEYCERQAKVLQALWPLIPQNQLAQHEEQRLTLDDTGHPHQPAVASASSSAAPSVLPQPQVKAKVCSACHNSTSHYSSAQLAKPASQRRCADCVSSNRPSAAMGVDGNRLKPASGAASSTHTVDSSSIGGADSIQQLRAAVTNEWMELRATDYAGWGCFARKQIRAGQVIVSDSRPLAETRQTTDELGDIATMAHLLVELQQKRPYLRQLSSRSWDALSSAVFSAVEERRLLSLRRNVDQDHWKQACGQIINNFFSTVGRNTLSLPLSFINHSCQPNAAVIPGTLRAVRDIKVGEEIVYDYCAEQSSMTVMLGSRGSAAIRQRELQERWGFRCQCRQCRGV